MIKPRKKYPSDKNTTTIRISRALHGKIKIAAQKDKRTIDAYVDIAMTLALENFTHTR